MDAGASHPVPFMTSETIRNHYDAFDRISEFGVKYASRFNPSTQAARLFGAITATTRELEALGATKLAAADHYHQGTSEKLLAIELLREELRAIRDTAKAIAVAEGLPNFAEPFSLPRSSSQALLLARAKTVTEAAAPHVAKFVEFELPAEFVTHLEESVARLEAADDHQNGGRSSRISGTADLTVAVVKGLQLRRQLMPLVRNKFKVEAGILAEWESAVRITRTRSPKTTVKRAKAAEQAL
jgi:hypothetical protein